MFHSEHYPTRSSVSSSSVQEFHYVGLALHSSLREHVSIKPSTALGLNIPHRNSHLQLTATTVVTIDSTTTNLHEQTPPNTMASTNNLPFVDDSVFPFPELTGRVRNPRIFHVNILNEMIEVFKEVASMVVKIYQNYQLRTRLQKSIMDSIKVDYWRKWHTRVFFRDGAHHPHTLTTLDVDKMFQFITEHIHHLTIDPRTVIEPDRDVTLAEAWIIQCAMHPEAERNVVTRQLWLSYLQIQPTIQEHESPNDSFFRHILVDAQNGGQVGFPGLDDALRPFVPNDEPSAVGIIQEYMRLGATAAYLWAHMWRAHGIQRGEGLTLDELHVRSCLDSTQYFYDTSLGNWSYPIPLRTRRHLTTMNLSGDLLYLIDYVFPKAIIPAGSTIREDEFAWQIQQWILARATTHARDPTGAIATRLQQLGLSPPSSDRSGFHHDLLRPFVQFNDNVPRHEDVVLEAYGPRIQIADFTRPMFDEPIAGTTCSICQEVYTSENSSSHSDSVYDNLWVNTICQHAFHHGCIDAWANNSVHANTVSCPNCRKKLCNARPRRVVQR